MPRVILTGDPEAPCAHVNGAEMVRVGEWVIGPEPAVIPPEVRALLGDEVDDYTCR